MVEGEGGIKDFIIGNEQELAARFAHMFPDADWQRYRRHVSPYTPLFIYGNVLKSGVVDGNRLIREHLQKHAYAYRLDIPHPDRISLNVLLSDLDPSTANASTLAGWFKDFYDPEKERLGGVATVDFQESTLLAPKQHDAMVTVDPSGPQPTFPVSVVGVTRENTPRGLIFFTKGKKPQGGISVMSRATQTVMVPAN